MNIDYEKYDIFIFDLDKTIWDTYNVHDDSIWAKQLIPPYCLEENKVVDDVFSYCILKPGIEEYLNFLLRSEKKIGFLSNGEHWGLSYEKQPSEVRRVPECLLKLVQQHQQHTCKKAQLQQESQVKAKVKVSVQVNEWGSE